MALSIGFLSGLSNGDLESDNIEREARAGPSKNGTEVNVVIARVRMTALSGRIDSGEESSLLLLLLSFDASFIISVEWLLLMVVPVGVGIGAIPWLLLFPT